MDEIELTILMPCLNEQQTVAQCVRLAQQFLAESGVCGEVLVADNGSTDNSAALAQEAGARVVNVTERGYGNALIGGIKAAHGKYIIMGDCDMSYDFLHLDRFIEKLREGYPLVMGCRMDNIAPGAMPFSHRYIGVPVLSFLGRLRFHTSVRDFHCGLRGFDRQKALALGLSCSGMEFATEIIGKFALSGAKIAEIPVTLAPDGRSGRSHLRTIRDGLRHIRYIFFGCRK
ncbi:MAG: glycosyltransferase family 2 protein [Oscillospiraceae bacterium]|nr:glycosyltransferase family 2 protein [Oscillospiraceae bacterium]